MSNFKLIYIAGFGRSGSTLLEQLLSAFTASYGLGELANFFDEIQNPQTFCSCGEKVMACPFWQGVYERFRRSIPWPLQVCTQVQLRVEDFRGPARANGKDRERYALLMQALLGAVQHQIPQSGSTLIDSSKTAYLCANRPYSISKHCSVDIRVIHLIRDFRGVLWSLGRGRNRALERGQKHSNRFLRTRAWLGWITANVHAAYARKRLMRNENVFIRYEDLVFRPVETLKTVCSALDLELLAPIAFPLNDSVPSVHQICGNRSRFFTPNIQPDNEWELEMPDFQKWIYYAITYPLMRKYSYDP